MTVLLPRITPPVLKESGIHYCKPERRHEGEHNHRRVSAWQLWRGIGDGKLLVALSSMNMMVGMPLQL